MSVDGRFIKYLSMELNQDLEMGRIQKISQISQSDFLFMIRAKGENKNLYLSLSTASARIHLIHQSISQFEQPGGFCMFLRKHVEGGVISNIQSINNDRIIQMTITNVNDLGDQVTYDLFIELFGRYANLIITDQEKQILNAYKHIHPFDDIDRTIVNGSPYNPPTDDKIDPEDMNAIKEFFNQSIIDFQTIIQNIRGVSPLLAKAITKKANHQEIHYFQAYQSLMEQAIHPTIEIKDKAHFYFIDIFNEPKRHFEKLSGLLEHYYKKQTEKEKVKQIHKYLSQLIKNQLNKDRNKLENLSKDLKKAQQNDLYRMKGDLIIQDQHKIKSTDYEYTGFSYELNQELTVALDRKISIIDNANRYYKKYKKLKTAIKHLNKQIVLTKHEINYFIGLKQQMEHNYIYKDLVEIRDELIQLKYIHKKKKSQKSKQQKLNFDIYELDDQTKFYVGKNNLQNNYLTHKFARKHDMWFHVQNQSGSHVIVSTNQLNEPIIRHAANLAAYHSKSQQSSSVAVDYTEVKNIKKIPGELGSLVTYTQQKTIYIDPDESMINSLKKIS
jgi:predicted ribosome quality control (RQC) complex YloA/Tae2 family protein